MDEIVNENCSEQHLQMFLFINGGCLIIVTDSVLIKEFSIMIALKKRRSTKKLRFSCVH